MEQRSGPRSGSQLPQAGAEKPERADARRNRLKVLAAAEIQYGYAGITWGNDYRKGIDEIAAVGYRGVQLRSSDGLLDEFRSKPAALKELLAHFLDHRKTVVIRRTRYDLRKAEERAHVLEGILKALDHLDEVIATIRTSRDPNEARERLTARLRS